MIRSGINDTWQGQLSYHGYGIPNKHAQGRWWGVSKQVVMRVKVESGSVKMAFEGSLSEATREQDSSTFLGMYRGDKIENLLVSCRHIHVTLLRMGLAAEATSEVDSDALFTNEQWKAFCTTGRKPICGFSLLFFGLNSHVQSRGCRVCELSYCNISPLRAQTPSA